MMTQETLKRTLGERLEKARKVNGWDQTDLAQRLGISRRSVTRYETDLKVPSLAVLIAWANVCDVPYSWLIDETFPGPDIQGYLGHPALSGRSRQVRRHAVLADAA